MTIAIKCLLVLLLLRCLLFANDDIFPSDDPSLVHNVSVISGHLNINFQDVSLASGHPLTLHRSYCSSGAFEKSADNIDISLQAYRQGWMPLGGWDLLAYTHLLVEPGRDNKSTKAYLAEKNGSTLSYTYFRRKGDSKISFLLKPHRPIARFAGALGAQNNPQNNILLIDPRSITQVLYTPDGGRRIYVGRKLTDFRGESLHTRRHFYRLSEEFLPSGHKIIYHYNKSNDLVRMEMRNPSGTKTFAFIDFEPHRSETILRELKVKTSTQQELCYKTVCFDKSYYISEVSNSCEPLQNFSYSLADKTLGAHVDNITIHGQHKLRVTYYLASSDKNSQHKVHMVAAPVGDAGQFLTVATFSYSSNYTDVRDSQGVLTRYHYDQDRLLKVDYFTQEGVLKSSQKFFWKGANLSCKALLDSAGNALFAKTFVYDEQGNVIEEALRGILTGEATSPLEIDDKGHVHGGESYTKNYRYTNNNLLAEEIEEGGLSYKYSYQPGTNLLIAKWQLDHGRIFLRSFFRYNQDHLLVEEITDDGSSDNVHNLTDVNHRFIKRIELHEKIGLPQVISEYCYDKGLGERLLKKTKLTYSPQNLVTSEEIYDARDVACFTIYTDYDSAGHMISKTTPEGKKAIYRYDELGQLIYSKEVSSPAMNFSYDPAGRQVLCRRGGKETVTTYDAKNRISVETDAQGGSSRHTYDEFNNRIATIFPLSIDEKGTAFYPEVYFSYDIQGNLLSTTLPRGEIVRTSYNARRKPLSITEANSSLKRHYYNKQGLLIKTLYADEREEHYDYDILQRMVSKKLFSAAGELLFQEEWRYSSFYLLSYRDARGLETCYTYDARGYKIQEKALDRVHNYFYDDLGRLIKTTGERSKCQIFNHDNLIVEEWDEDDTGRQENRTLFLYDEENRRSEARRLTSAGEARDYFAYDEEGRLTLHQDPLSHKTQFIFQEKKNLLGQSVIEKTTIDPLGHMTIETKDNGERLISKEKRSKDGKKLFKEDYFYDRSGNKAKICSDVFIEGEWQRQSVIILENDSMGHLVRQIENDEKVSSYVYDAMGRLMQKTFPNNISLSYIYDHADRPVSLQSSDHTIHLSYAYQGVDLSSVFDHVNNVEVTHKHNLFGELTEERIGHRVTSWDYDQKGRLCSLTLPGGSSLRYDYEGAHMKRVKRLSADQELLYIHNYDEFDLNGHISKERLINGIVVKSEHDLLERPLCSHSVPLSHAVSYGPSGLIMSSESSLFGPKTFAYDDLNQLTKEGEEDYHFDSLGNPTNCLVNCHNQILQGSDCEITYDLNGNPIRRTLTDGRVIEYSYDALNRLREILYPHERKVIYHYDPLSRLLSKTIYSYETEWLREEEITFLYDQDKEIGALDQDNKITQLKILGLGIQGDMGAAVAIELDGQVYAPLHDFRGNIVALTDSAQELVECYDIGAFGKEQTSLLARNPWRFCSKRSDEGLIFFGLRFYDPALSRWLTPDPAGFVDGSNLYLYVFNNPLNRLDLFGLFTDDYYRLRPGDYLLLQMASTPIYPGQYTMKGKGLIGGQQVDFVTSCGHWHQLKFSAEEKQNGYFNLFEHFEDLTSREGALFNICSYGNGVRTNFQDFYDACDKMGKEVEGLFCLSVHTPTKNLRADCFKAITEFCGEETAEVVTTRQFMSIVSSKLYQINPNALWLYMPHSRNGAISKRAIEGLPSQQKELLCKNLHLFALGPMECIPKHGYAASAINVFSSCDGITANLLPFSLGIPTKLLPYYQDHDIRIVKSLTPIHERDGYYSDHSFLGKTYTHARQKNIYDLKKSYGFYQGNVQEKKR